jgi:ribonuclease E
LLSDREAEIEAEPEVPTNSDLPLSINSKVGWIEKPERARPTKPEPVKPVIEPPETVYVEMTSEEQDVYALMGVSPLVRLNREVKNPKSVIVHVTLPGQVPDTSTVSENSTPAPTSTNEVAEVETYNTVSPVVSPSESFDSLAESLDSPSESFVSPAESFNSPAESLPDATTELSSAATTTNESEPASTSPARRRRRRSSATENSMEE